MALDQRLSLNLKLSQKLIMTPSLQQAIKLLQLNKLELLDVLTQELVENPILEETLNEPANGAEETALADPPAPEVPEKTETSTSDDDIDMEAYFHDYLDSAAGHRAYQGMTEIREFPSYENFLRKPATLSDHLLWQLGIGASAPLLKEVAEAVIGNLDADGYLAASPEEIQAMGGYDPPVVARAIELIQKMDPPGLGARSLQECLLLQIGRLGLQGTPVEEILRHHLDLLQRHKYQELARKLGCSLDEAGEYLRIIRQLDPKPGVKFNETSSQYVAPDVYVVKVDDDYVILLNEDGLPKLKLSPYYRQMLDRGTAAAPETRNFIREKFRSALWLIKSLEQRQRTIYKVAESLVRHQRDFLDKGIEYMRPLVLRDVAEDIQMHESTVSRVVANKYMDTPRGLFEMRYFFHSGLQGEGGKEVSSLSVKKQIQKLIAEEDTDRPLSDSSIVGLLRRDGLEIARRTVAKYREELRIPSSTQRRQIP